MGYIRHHAIIATSYDDKIITKVHARACELFVNIGDIIKSPVNGYCSVFIPPDGSKEGWIASKNGEISRRELIQFMEEFRYDDGSMPITWVYVQYGDENRETLIVDHSDNKIHRIQSILSSED
jgi:hypothetical protein